MTEARARLVPAAGPPRATRRSTRPGWSRRATPTGCSPPRATSAPTRWVAYLEPLPGPPARRRPAALRRDGDPGRAAYGVKDSIRDALPAELTEPFLDSIDRLIRELNRAAGLSPSSSGLNASSRNGEGTAGSYRRVSERRARVHAT